MAEAMKVYQKWEDMMVYLYRAMQSYPRTERYTLAADTRHAALLLGRNLYRASMAKEKHRLLQQADDALVDLKLLVRLGMLLECLPIKKYELLIEQTAEIGKMIGGWLKGN